MDDAFEIVRERVVGYAAHDIEHCLSHAGFALHNLEQGIANNPATEDLKRPLAAVKSSIDKLDKHFKQILLLQSFGGVKNNISSNQLFSISLELYEDMFERRKIKASILPENVKFNIIYGVQPLIYGLAYLIKSLVHGGIQHSPLVGELSLSAEKAKGGTTLLVNCKHIETALEQQFVEMSTTSSELPYDPSNAIRLVREMIKAKYHGHVNIEWTAPMRFIIKIHLPNQLE